MTGATADVRDYRDEVENIEIAWIPMPDGRRLAARLLLPRDAEENPVPAILEYIPYRRRDGTRVRDDEVHYWFAGNGYASVRVDISGSGDSDGLIEDEYALREQDDALVIIEWLAAQTWCSGAVGMIGISWGGFNGLQVAARRPPALKAVISLCSTVDRYADDVHFMGGCLLNDTLDWGTAFFTYGGLPPDPEIVGKDAWRDTWRQRLEGLDPYPAIWMKHQRRDDFWRHGSVCEDYSAIRCPVLAVSGWVDGYTAAVFRLVENLSVLAKGIAGPWGHKYPNSGVPGPAIGFLQECRRWWDRWLKGIETGVEADPAMRVYVQDSLRPAPHHDERPGHWVGLQNWPPADESRRLFHLDGATLTTVKSPDQGPSRSVLSPQTTGLGSGEWCAYGLGKIAPELPLDQSADDAGSLVYDSAPLDKALTIIGRPQVNLRLAADQAQAMVAVRLNEIQPDGSVARVTYGLLNLSHRDGSSDPQPMVPGQFCDVTIPLNEIAQTIRSGNRLRLAVSTSYWPMAWPSPDPARVTVDPAHSSLEIPVAGPDAAFSTVSFAPVEHAPAAPVTIHAAGSERREVIHDIDTQTTTFRGSRDDGRYVIDDIGTEIAYTKVKEFTIQRDDPNQAVSRVACSHAYNRGDWHTRVKTEITLRSDSTHFHLTARIVATDDGSPFFEKEFQESFARDHL